MEYRITFRNQLKALGFLVFLILFYIACVLYFGYKDGFNKTLLDFFLIVFLISFLPVVYLHIEYYCHNRDARLKIDTYEKKLYYEKNKIVEALSFEELDRIILYMAPSWHRGSSFQLLPFEQYHYARIKTKKGKELIFTCLMAERVQDAVKQIKGVPIEKKKRLYASILIEHII